MTIIQPGQVFWITGVTGTGKTTVGQLLHRRLLQSGRNAVFLDGDTLRATIADDLGYAAPDRLRSASRNARLCQLLASQGLDVVCATISLFHEVQRWNRDNIPNYREIFLRVPRAELEKRDPKLIYARAKSGDLKDVTGVDIPAEEPQRPDLVIENWGALAPDDAVDRIWKRFGQPAEGAPRVAAQDKHLVALAFSTKAETLDQLVGRLHTARVLPQVRFSVAEWKSEPEAVIARLQGEGWHRSQDRAQRARRRRQHRLARRQPSRSPT